MTKKELEKLKEYEEKTQKFIKKIENNQVNFKTKKEKQNTLTYQKGFLQALRCVLAFATKN